MSKYQWYHTAMECGDCEYKFVVDVRKTVWRNRLIMCPKCRSAMVTVDSERDLDITEAIAQGN